MAKGDDAVQRKKTKSMRKKMRNESTVSARVAAIIASKRRRKAGKRRKCEGMCFSLPTHDDPFNDRNDPKARKAMKKKDDLQKPRLSKDQKYQTINVVSKRYCREGPNDSRKVCNLKGIKDSGPSKFLLLCLETIQKSWIQGVASNACQFEPFLFSDWGIDFWNNFTGGLDILDMSNASATKEQVAWVISIASDVFTRKEKEGTVTTTPFLLYIVQSQQKTTEIRSLCKPLKGLGIHTVSLHSGAMLDHQVHGLKSCEPEFIVTTPERLLELIDIKAVDVSGVSMLVFDGLEGLLSSGSADILLSIKKCVRGNHQTVVFSRNSREEAGELLKNLTGEPLHKLSLFTPH